MPIKVAKPKDDDQFPLNTPISVEGTADSEVTAVTLYSPYGGVVYPLVSNPILVTDGKWETTIIFNTGGERSVVIEGLDAEGNSLDFEPLEITLLIDTKFIKPVGTGFRITSDFRPPNRPNHRGIDIAHNGGPTMTTGKPVYAVADGKVAVAVTGCAQDGDRDCGGGYGNVVYLNHDNDLQTRYAHLLEVKVSLGETVKQGDIIGKMGNSGRSTGPHLHFEVRQKSTGVPLEPKSFIPPIG